MIYRGLYGLGRFVLDILAFDSSADFVDDMDMDVDVDCLSNISMLDKIDDPKLFLNIIDLKSNTSL